MAQINVGDQAPDFETVNDQNEKVKLSELKGKRVVLYFYPKDDTPGCTTQACGFRDNYAEIMDKNAIVLGVSPDDVKSHQGFKSKYDLPFPLLVDQDHAISEAYGVWVERSMYGRTFMGVNRSHFVIDENGKVIDAQYGVKADDSAELSRKVLSS
ncbi:MAG TPA: thioredoxin-dependent thiol peroxidase [Dehalococcoidia bacterium]|nr:thioredoxin-dependent thiol peroxidase [Dehalococcoidia bacterium]